MANKKFGDLKGVVLSCKENESQVIECSIGKSDEWDIVSCGDVIFEVDIEHKTINRCNVKYIYRDYHGSMTFYYCDARYNRDFKPNSETFYGRGIPNDMKRASCMYNKSTYGLLCTNMEEAIETLARINNEKYFGALKNGDKVYIVDKEDNIVREETVERIFYNTNIIKYFNISTEHYLFYCGSEYEENASDFSDISFYAYREGKMLNSKKYSIHMDKNVADRVLREYLNSRKNAEKKKLEKPNIPIGTPIRHTDNKNKELHYGDEVAYVRKNWLGHTDISFGVVVGDSDKKIKIFDNEEAGKKRDSWSDETKNGIHYLEPANILLIKLGKQ